MELRSLKVAFHHPSGLTENDVTEATFIIHETGNNIFESEGSKGCAGDVDNDRLIGRGKAIQKNANHVEIWGVVYQKVSPGTIAVIQQ